MRKSSKITILVFILILVNAFPTFAEEQQLIVSKWALVDLMDSQRQGIFSTNNIKENLNLTNPITKSQLENLNNNTKNKLNNYNIEKNKNYSKTTYPEDLSRKHILYSVFNLICEYTENCNNNDPINFLLENSILKGDGKNLLLEKPATYENAISFYNRAIDYIIQNNNVASKGMLYKIENNGNTVYLLGSIHIGDHSMYPLDKSINDAFNNSSEIYVEVNVTDNTIVDYMQKEKYHNDNLTLKDDLGPVAYDKYKNFMTSLNINEDMYINLKPWSAYNLLSNLPMSIKMPNSSSLGIDRYFISKAKLTNKKINELENIELQTNILSQFDKNTYIEMIDDFINTAQNYGFEPFVQNSVLLKNIWKTGDSDALNAHIYKEDEFTGNLFDQRDILMADKIQSMLSSNDKKTIFVIAGAAHFTPKDSVIKILENRNFTVNKI